MVPPQPPMLLGRGQQAECGQQGGNAGPQEWRTVQASFAEEESGHVEGTERACRYVGHPFSPRLHPDLPS